MSLGLSGVGRKDCGRWMCVLCGLVRLLSDWPCLLQEQVTSCLLLVAASLVVFGLA